MEIFDWFPDVGDPMRAWSSRLQAVERYAISRMGSDELPVVSGCWIVRATRRNRELIGDLTNVFNARFPGSANAWLKAMADPGAEMPRDAALLWVSVSGGRLFSGPAR